MQLNFSSNARRPRNIFSRLTYYKRERYFISGRGSRNYFAVDARYSRDKTKRRFFFSRRNGRFLARSRAEGDSVIRNRVSCTKRLPPVRVEGRSRDSLAGGYVYKVTEISISVNFGRAGTANFGRYVRAIALVTAR